MAPRLIAALVLLLSLLPVTAVLAGGELDVEYGARLLDWTYGTALCAGIGALAWYVLRAQRPRPDLANAPPPAAPLPAGFAGSGFLAAASLGALGLYLLVARTVFSGRPLHIDEIVQALQARWLAAGQLSVPTPTPREFYSILNLVDLGDRSFAQFPVGGPAMLAVGRFLGGSWVVGPLAGAVCVWCFGQLLRATDPDATRRWHRGAVLLFALAPFGAFMFGSHMNHATTLAWLLIAAVAVERATRAGAAIGWGALAGIALGVAASIRPLDAVVFALPAAGWLLWRARHGGRALATLLASGVGIAIPLALLLLANAATTGRPTLFGYDLLWGAGHGLGFHQSPWGPAHTPARGLELVSLYLTRLNVHLFETPFPALLPAAIALWVARPLRAIDRYLLVAAALLLLAYAAYWHDGSYLGPRFVFVLLPLGVLWTARVTQAFAGRPRVLRRGAQVALVAGAVYAVVTVLSVRMPQYRNSMTSVRVDVSAAARAAGVQHALVLVRESWGAQLMVRLWAVGIPRSASEMLYRRVDACRLEHGLRAVEERGLRGAAALADLAPLQADSSRLVRSPFSPDGSERFAPGTEYSELCNTRIADDRSGFSLFAPFRLAEDDNVYARWLPGREAEIAAQHPNRPVIILGRAGSAVDAPLTWHRWIP